LVADIVQLIAWVKSFIVQEQKKLRYLDRIDRTFVMKKTFHKNLTVTSNVGEP